MKRKPTKLNVMSIVHGKSELLMCSSVKSNLKIKHEIHAKDRGRHSIQVNSVLQELNSKKFNMSLKDFSEKYDISYDSKNKRLVNFTLFIIMDLDDCTQEKAEQFKNKSMFNEHILYEYIVPIYNDPNLEKTIHDLGININKKEKVKGYIKIFPTNKGDLDIHMAEEFAEKLNKKCKNSNLGLYFDYCVSIARKNLIK
ncbi:hypothetical protein [uncultured Anaerococcus sp.]|uniref:hypothetical protein n=1 Tax=uncultured Anaerococcus sp. TaxID=293428 RepID=UPI002888F96F|nr:hypothetical protein [uncultured Anaerococcus sp.]